jgi:hypothetical protein
MRSTKNWLLQGNQNRQLSAFLKHIELGVLKAAEDPESLLIFSGGETRRDAGPISEAQSYWLYAEHSDWFGYRDTNHPRETSTISSIAEDAGPGDGVDEDWTKREELKRTGVRWRTTTEEFARDSMENLLFSICRFREATGRYPVNITVVGFSFKRQRFSTLHRAALRFPEDKFHYVGYDHLDPVDLSSGSNGQDDEELLRQVLEGEKKTRDAFVKDPYSCLDSEKAPSRVEDDGVRGITGGMRLAHMKSAVPEDLRTKTDETVLKHKKRDRNPFRREHPYPKGCPEIKMLFTHCSSRHYRGLLPW